MKYEVCGTYPGAIPWEIDTDETTDELRRRLEESGDCEYTVTLRWERDQKGKAMTFVEQMIEDTHPSEVYRSDSEVVLFWNRPIKILSLASDVGLDIDMFSKVADGKRWALSIPPEIADGSDEDE